MNDQESNMLGSGLDLKKRVDIHYIFDVETAGCIDTGATLTAKHIGDFNPQVLVSAAS